jgi:uncharacterized protein (TIGR03085 family)
MTSLVVSEREALCDLFLTAGPDAPTLCEGWTTRDLAAHLVLREGRPDAAVGLVVGPLAGWTRRVQAREARRDWSELVERVRRGPWPLSPSRIGSVDAAVNTVEFFVHHEDVRRAQPGWEPRALDPRVDEALWAAVVKRAGLYLRQSPVGLVLANVDGRRVVAKAGDPTVTVTGEPAELVLLMHGRADHALVELSGEPEAVQEFRQASFRV